MEAKSEEKKNAFDKIRSEKDEGNEEETVVTQKKVSLLSTTLKNEKKKTDGKESKRVRKIEEGGGLGMRYR